LTGLGQIRKQAAFLKKAAQGTSLIGKRDLSAPKAKIHHSQTGLSNFVTIGPINKTLEV
jgi:hypothetical protein